MTTAPRDLLIQPIIFDNGVKASADRMSPVFQRLLETQQMDDPLSRTAAVWCDGNGTVQVWEPPDPVARAVFASVPRWFAHEELTIHGAVGDRLDSPSYDTLHIDGKPVRCPEKAAYFVEREDPYQRVVICCETSIADTRTIRVMSGEPDPPEAWIERLRVYAKRHNHMRGRCVDPAGDLIVPAQEGGGLPISLGDVVLTPEQKSVVQRHILGFADRLRKPGSFNGRMQRGVLLEGPPGCGKSRLLRALLTELKGLSVCLATPSHISRTGIDELHHVIDFISPCVVMIEEIDIFGQDRSLGGHPEMAELMQMLDGLRTIPGVLWIATTNRIEAVEQALADRPGRFDRRIAFGPLPNAERARLVDLLARPLAVESEAQGLLLAKTHEMTGAQVREILETARLIHHERGIDDQHLGSEVVWEALADCGFNGNRLFGFTAPQGPSHT